MILGQKLEILPFLGFLKTRPKQSFSPFFPLIFGQKLESYFLLGLAK